ncbi:hypothetical protein HETIRDRAFT_168813 [Heterobasidion irregulare TC 32-1]|uniref:Uncharacterized protein n=1 Tax=Heterobasidion irregulare (strain TC 32-1) TaxID=747525 RepID=W4K8S6_HETIT|nr:uncharacterized protein HETIRDRAFT_168813 [Heterobasidion irregulare TC 32-1]ETW82237.1 hypothetical protein HETIRDRAFT_168813 [Heterobasidion irregulare TC 32-1]
MNVSENSEIVQHVGRVILTYVIQVVITCLFFGVYFILVLYLIYLSYQGTIISRAKSYMFAATMLIFIIAAITSLITIINTIQSIQDVLVLIDNQPLEKKFSKINQRLLISGIISYFCRAIIAFLGNIIIVWRAQILWKNHYIMAFTKGIFIVTTMFTIPNYIINALGDINGQDWEFIYSRYFQIAQWGLEFILNLVVTILIAYKAWEYRQSVKAYLANNKKTQIEKILALLIDIHGLSVDIFFDLGAFLTGIYPTIIMIVVSLNNTVEEMSRISVPIVHASIPQELGGFHDLSEAEFYQSQSIHEHDIVLDIEIVEESRE